MLRNDIDVFKFCKQIFINNVSLLFFFIVVALIHYIASLNFLFFDQFDGNRLTIVIIIPLCKIYAFYIIYGFLR